MTTQHYGPTTGPTSKTWVRVVVAIVIALLALALLVGAFLLGRGSSDPEPGPVTTPQPTASAEETSAAPTPSAEPTPTQAESTTASEPTVEEKPAAPGPLNAAQLKAGDFSSAAGTWTSPSGDTLTITGDQITWGTVEGPFATVDGTQITFSSGDQYVTESHTPIDGLHPEATVLWWGFDEQGYAHGSMLAFLPAGVPADSILGVGFTADAGQDRILALPGIAAGRLLPSDLTEYVATRADGDPPAEATPSAEPTQAAGCSAPVAGAYECAGGPRPAESKELTAVLKSSYGDPTGILVTPSGNIACDIRAEAAGPTMACMVRSWETDPPVEPAGGRPVDGYSFIEFGDGSAPPVYGGVKNDPFCSFGQGACSSDNNPAPQVLNYGEVAHFAGFVCASADNGLTCWNEDTGHGAFFSRSQFGTF